MPNNNQYVENQNNDIEIQEFLDRQDWKGYGDSWVCDGFRMIYVNSSCKASLSTFTNLDNIWQKKRGHIFFDKYVKLFFSRVTPHWNELSEAFLQLKSKEMSRVIGEERKDINSAKKSGGANIVVDSEDLTLSRNLPKGIKSNEKPLTFEAGNSRFSLFPTFVAGSRVGSKVSLIVPLWEVSMTDDHSIMIGTAPRDAKVIRQVPKNINLSGRNKGKADKRFNQNKMLDEYQLDSIIMKLGKTDIEYRFSNHGRADEFCSAFSKYLFAQTAEAAKLFSMMPDISTIQVQQHLGIDHNLAERVLKKMEDFGFVSEPLSNGTRDVLYDEMVENYYSDAVEFVTKRRTISTAQLQKHLSIDQEMAERLFEKMGDVIVSEPNSHGIRDVLITYSEIFGTDET